MSSPTEANFLAIEMDWEANSCSDSKQKEDMPKTFLLHPELNPWKDLHYSYESFSLYPIRKLYWQTDHARKLPPTPESELIKRLKSINLQASDSEDKASSMSFKEQISVYMEGMTVHLKMSQQEHYTGELQAKWISNYIPLWADTPVLTFRGGCALCVYFAFGALMKHWPTFRVLGSLSKVPRAQIFCWYRIVKERHEMMRGIAPWDKIGLDVDKLLCPFGEAETATMSLLGLCDLVSTRLQLDQATGEIVMGLGTKILNYQQFANHNLPTIVASSVHIASRLMKYPVDSMDASVALDVGLLTMARLCQKLYCLRHVLVEQSWLDSGADMARFPAN